MDLIKTKIAVIFCLILLPRGVDYSWIGYRQTGNGLGVGYIDWGRFRLGNFLVFWTLFRFKNIKMLGILVTAPFLQCQLVR